MTNRVLVLGAGAAGSAVANKLAREFRQEIAKEEVEITILDKNDVNINQGGFTFIPFGLYTPEDISRSRKKLISPRVKCVFREDGEIERVDLANREVTVKTGRNYSCDYLVIATGCIAVVGSVQGLSDDFNTFHTSLEDAFKLRKLVRTFDKGHIVISVAQMPIPCPGAPGKFAVMLDAYLRYIRDKEVRKNVEISFLWPIGPIGPPAYNKIASETFEEQNINLIRNFRLTEVDADKKEVVAESGDRVKYDLLISIPPHKGIKALADSGIAVEGNWIPVDKSTLQYRGPVGSYDEVYALGDGSTAGAVKTGIGAHYQSLVVGQNLVNDLHGNGIKVSYMGELGCPFVGAIYTPSTRGKAYIPTWTYDKLPEPFKPTKLGWFLYRMYYYIYWYAGLRALM